MLLSKNSQDALFTKTTGLGDLSRSKFGWPEKPKTPTISSSTMRRSDRFLTRRKGAQVETDDPVRARNPLLAQNGHAGLVESHAKADQSRGTRCADDADQPVLRLRRAGVIHGRITWLPSSRLPILPTKVFAVSRTPRSARILSGSRPKARV